MNTTDLYVEYVVIGLETLCWIFLVLYIIIGDAFLGFLSYCISNIFPTIFLIGVCYVLGLVTDRFVDHLFEKRKNTIKKGYPINSSTSLLVWEQHEKSTFASFTLSRIRILRSTAINCALISVFGSYSIYKYYFNIKLILFVFFLFMTISLTSNSAHKTLLEIYYKKTSLIEKARVAVKQRDKK